jgi:ankyrin repeat protein
MSVTLSLLSKDERSDKNEIINFFELARVGKKKELDRYLENNPLDVNKKEPSNRYGNTCLIFACLHGHTDVANMIVERGGDVELKNNYGRTPLMIASENGNPKLVQKLLHLGASTSQTTKEGLTALWFACQWKKLEAAEILIASGAVVVLTVKGLNPLDLLNEEGQNRLELAFKSYKDKFWKP